MDGRIPHYQAGLSKRTKEREKGSRLVVDLEPWAWTTALLSSRYRGTTLLYSGLTWSVLALVPVAVGAVPYYWDR